MTEVLFFQQIDDELLSYAAVAARFHGKWAFYSRGDGGAYEMPGSPRQDGENIEQTARRGLYETTGAARFRLWHVSAYAERGDDGSMKYGMLYYAEIQEFFEDPGLGEDRVGFFQGPPENLASPRTQPALLRRAQETAAKENGSGNG